MSYKGFLSFLPGCGRKSYLLSVKDGQGIGRDSHVFWDKGDTDSFKVVGDVTEVDLRWGIPEEQLNDSAILEIRINEVLYCAPFFVGIGGNRYGTIATYASLNSLPETLRIALGDDIPEGGSIM